MDEAVGAGSVATGCPGEGTSMAAATLTISSKNYSSWSLRGWLLCRMAGIPFTEVVQSADDASTRAELLLLSPSFLVPCLRHEGATVWDTLAIADYLNELVPEAKLLPSDRIERAHCRSVSGEMHSGFANLRSALPLNLKAHFPAFKVWAGALPDIERIETIWQDCLGKYSGPFLFGQKPTVADAMYAPVALRFQTYDVALSPASSRYVTTIADWQPIKDWKAAALNEPEEIEELDVEF